MTELLFIKPLIKSVSASSEDRRIFSGFGSVEIYDHENDKIDVDAVARHMNTILQRGGTILDTHTNKIVGKILDWKKAIDPSTGEEGVWLQGEIFRNFTIDDEVWNNIKNNEYKGFSLGGRAVNTKTLVDGGSFKTEIPDLEVWEFSVVRDPCNPAAKFDKINYVAKNKEDCKMIKKEESPDVTPEEEEEKPTEKTLEDVVKELLSRVQYLEESMQPKEDDDVDKTKSGEEGETPPKTKPEEEDAPKQESVPISPEAVEEAVEKGLKKALQELGKTSTPKPKTDIEDYQLKKNNSKFDLATFAEVPL